MKGYYTMANENKLQDIIQTSLENIRTMIDADTVIGNPIVTESGTTIIPISKISMGFASGGVDFSKKGVTNEQSKPQNFGGGGGTGLSIVPVGFLAISKEGEVELINIGDKPANDPVEQIASLIERSPELINKIKSLFKKKPPVDETPDEE
jgi:sporulation protein YtfJ